MGESLKDILVILHILNTKIIIFKSIVSLYYPNVNLYL